MKKIILPVVAVGLMFATANTMRTSQCRVKAEEESSEEIIETSEKITEEVLENDEIKEWFTNQYDTLIVPLFSGVTITSVLSALISIAFAVFNRKTNKKIKLSSEELNALSLQVLTASTQLIKEMTQSNSISVETRDLFVKTTDDLITKLADLTDKTEKLIELKSNLYAIANILKEIASGSKELVANGVAEKCEKVMEEIKNI